MSADLTLVALASGGTLALVAAAYLLGFNKTGRFSDASMLQEIIKAKVPHLVLTDSLISTDQSAALMKDGCGDLFFAVFIGDSLVVRAIEDGNLQFNKSGYIVVNFCDFGFPIFKLRFNREALAPIIQFRELSASR